MTTAIKQTRLSEVKQERDSAKAKVSQLETLLCWMESERITRPTRSWSWRDELGGKYTAKLYVGPRATRGLIHFVFAAEGNASASVTVYELDEWRDYVGSSYGISDVKYRNGLLAANDGLSLEWYKASNAEE